MALKKLSLNSSSWLRVTPKACRPGACNLQTAHVRSFKELCKVFWNLPQLRHFLTVEENVMNARNVSELHCLYQLQAPPACTCDPATFWMDCAADSFGRNVCIVVERASLGFPGQQTSGQAYSTRYRASPSSSHNRTPCKHPSTICTVCD
jgi:hypothetical protein